MEGHSSILGGPASEEHGAGVGLLLSPEAPRAVECYECISNRLLTARVNCGIIRMTIDACYAPTDVAEAEEKDQFYQSFEDLRQRVDSHDLQVVVGDFNARVGKALNNFLTLMLYQDLRTTMVNAF